MRLRQLVFVSRERDRLARQICTLLDLKETYHDAGLINFGLENVLIPLGDTFFEIVMPVQENTTAERFLEKRNGDGGYMVIVDVDDFESEQKRVESSGIEIVWHGNRNEDEINARTIHLHPKQVGGAILSQLCMQWEKALGIKRAQNELKIQLAESTINFVESIDGRGEGINAFKIKALNKDQIIKNAKSMKIFQNEEILLGGVKIILE